MNNLISLILSASLFSSTLLSPLTNEKILASHEISLNNRYPVASVSEIFKDNILLNMAYMKGQVKSKEEIVWESVKAPFKYEFRLNPGETFTFHDDILPKYSQVVKTTNAHFNSTEGFKSDGYLFGDGICHLASLIYWVAKDAGLEAVAPTNHNFMAIPEIQKQFGVSIYANPFSKGSHRMQNLYVTNNNEKAIDFRFNYDGDKLNLTIVEKN